MTSLEAMLTEFEAIDLATEPGRGQVTMLFHRFAELAGDGRETRAARILVGKGLYQEAVALMGLSLQQRRAAK